MKPTISKKKVMLPNVRPDLSEPEFQLTESEIKRDFEWAWQFAKEVE